MFPPILVAALLQLTAGPAGAQLGGGGSAYALEDGERNLKFAAVPIPNYSDVLGWSLGVVGMAYYKLDRHDDDLPPSTTGLVGFYSENKSWIGMVFQKLHFKEDRWRATAVLGTGSLKYQFNPSGIGPGLPDVFIDYTTVTDFAYLKPERLVREDVYVGLEALGWSALVSLDPDLIGIPTEHYRALGATGNWDRRDHIMQPRSGTNLDVRWRFYDEAFGSDRNFRNLTATVTGYTALGDSTRILAGRLLTESAFGDVPFSGQAILSGNRNLRGYSNGRNRGDKLLTLEAEYRWNFAGRLGAVGFAGVGFVGPDWSTYTLDDALPAAGIGLRFRMIDAYRINARIDYGWGRDDQAVYVSIGEAY